MTGTYDYIIVGGGSAGGVIANRLSADAANRVLILEAGGMDRGALMRMPLAAGKMFYDPAHNWPLETDPEPHADDRAIGLAAGRVLGGGSSINGMMYTRGHPRDYDQWAQMGCTGWSHSDVLPYFLKAERNWRGGSDAHGGDGPLTTSAPLKDDLFHVLAETARRRGLKINDDFETNGPDGFGLTDLTTHRGRRGSSARRYLRPALKRSNLTLIANASVHRVLIESGRAVGVEYEQGGALRTASAAREVILAAGAYHSPKLLMLSGVGPADDLAALGIPCVLDLPGVGRNLQDHYGYSIVYDTKEAMHVDHQTRLDRLVRSVLRWGLTGRGPVAGLPLSGVAFCRTREGMERPDVELLFTPAALDAQVWFPGWRGANGQKLAVSVSLLRPQSVGRVTLRSADPLAAVRVLKNYLADPEDRATLLRAAQLVREFMSTEPVAGIVRGEVFPGPDSVDDEGTAAFIRATVRSMLHACGTCAMGTGPGSVVDAQLRLNGVDGLRIADASVMPSIPSGHTNAPTIMIAEKAADLILGARASSGGAGRAEVSRLQTAL